MIKKHTNLERAFNRSFSEKEIKDLAFPPEILVHFIDLLASCDDQIDDLEPAVIFTVPDQESE